MATQDEKTIMHPGSSLQVTYDTQYNVVVLSQTTLTQTPFFAKRTSLWLAADNSGGPGVGKSHLVKVLQKISDMMMVGEQLRSSYLGIAAVNIGGYSLCSFLDIPTNLKAGTQKIRPWNKEKLREFTSDHDLDNISSFVIDEISTSGPDIVACVDQRLQQARANNKVFGNIAVIFLGDYDQLPPVIGDSIPTTIVNLHRTSNNLNFLQRRQALSVATRGATLFQNIQHLKLTEQHRSVDPSHTRFIQSLARTGQVSTEEMKKLYKPLAKEDEQFRHATIIVSGNYERHVINMEQSKRWAQSHKTHVLRWRRKLKEWRGKPSTVENIADATKQACFWENFVSGALGFVNYNLNTKIGIANGTGIRYHSISFEDPTKNEALLNQIENTPEGGTITLEDPPDYINVEMYPDLDEDSDEDSQKKKRLRKEWTYGSLDNTGHKVIIPISTKGAFIKTKKEVVGGSTGAGYRPSNAVLQDHFPLELAFAMTVHKAQGRTIKKLILAISQHPLAQLQMKWESVYTALTRVRKGEDIRLLITKKQWDKLDYLSDLSKNAIIRQFFTGYPDEQGSFVRWDADLMEE